MCGLIGMVGTLEHKHKQVMKDLFFLNTLRGKDSTGLTVVDRKRGVLTRKMTCPGYEFIDYPVVERAMCTNDQLWMGHGRYKTTGDVSRANAHPFEVCDDKGAIYLVGTHNGTLNNKYEIERMLKDEKFDTDSEALFNWLVEAPNYKEAIKPLRGAWSLVWWDALEDTLYFCRNKERPMSIAFSKDRKVMMWASEAWMLINACRRNGVELMQNDKGISCFFTLTDHLYSLKIPQPRDQVLPELIKEGGYTGAPVGNFQGQGWQKWSHWWDSEDDPNFGIGDPSFKSEGKREGASAIEKGTQKGKADEKANVIIGFPKSAYKGFKGTPVENKKRKKLLEEGCCWCKSKQPIPQDNVIAFVDENHIVCSRCMRDAHPKGDCVRQREDDLDDDLPFELGPKIKDSPEYSSLIAASVKKTVG